MRTHTFILVLIIVGICSCTNDVLISLKDCPHNDKSIDIQSIEGDGDTYIVDANFDGQNDVIKGNEKENVLFLWNKADKTFSNYGNFYSYPIFSSSDKSIYSFSIEKEELLFKQYQWEKNSIVLSSYKNCPANEHSYYSFKMSSPETWKEVIDKMELDYHVNELLTSILQEKTRKQREDSIKHVEDSIQAIKDAYKAYQQACEYIWVDMGIESDDGEPLYWATSDLIMRNDNTFGLSEYGKPGASFGWGDITGKVKNSNDMENFGGNNPPSSIIGNPLYDIVAAHLDSPIRLPSKTEWIRLFDNCEREFTTIKKNDTEEEINGLPSWAQGQWMTEARIPQIRDNALISLSVKIDGLVCSVICSQGGQVLPIYSGFYDYLKEENKLILGSLIVYVNKEEHLMTTESGHELRKINSNTESSSIYGLLLVSRINGQKLFFPIPSPNVAIRKGNLGIQFESTQEKEYWSGTLYEEDKKCAFMLHLKGSNPTEIGLGYDKRYNTAVRLKSGAYSLTY